MFKISAVFMESFLFFALKYIIWELKQKHAKKSRTKSWSAKLSFIFGIIV